MAQGKYQAGSERNSTRVRRDSVDSKKQVVARAGMVHLIALSRARFAWRTILRQGHALTVSTADGLSPVGSLFCTLTAHKGYREVNYAQAHLHRQL